MRPAVKQLRIELGLQRLDLLAQGRLLDAQPFGGARDMALLGHGDEIAEVA
jgi:hypothetical protein